QAVAGGKVEREAQAEADAFLHFGDALEQLLAGNEVQAAALVVGAEIAPVRSFGSPFPALLHGSSSFTPAPNGCLAHLVQSPRWADEELSAARSRSWARYRPLRRSAAAAFSRGSRRRASRPS